MVNESIKTALEYRGNFHFIDRGNNKFKIYGVKPLLNKTEAAAKYVQKSN